MFSFHILLSRRDNDWRRSGAIRCGGWILGAGPHADDLGGRGTYAQIVTSAGRARIGIVRTGCGGFRGSGLCERPAVDFKTNLDPSKMVEGSFGL